MVQAGAERSSQCWRNAARIAAPLAVFKLLQLGVIVSSLYLLPPLYFERNYDNHFHRSSLTEGPILRHFIAWDAHAYLRIANEGYQAEPALPVFYPLWPMCIRAATWVTRLHPTLTAVILSNVLSLAGLVLLHHVFTSATSGETADLALPLLLALPGALFFIFPYAESLFLLLAAIFLWALLDHRYAWLALAAFLMPLTRPVGLFTPLPIAVGLWCAPIHQPGRRLSPARWLLLLAPLAGFGALLITQRLLTGDMLAFFHTQTRFVTQSSVAKMFDPVALVRTFFYPVDGTTVQIHGVANSAIDRAQFVLCLVCLMPLFRMNKTLFAYALVMGVLPASSNAFCSYTRYLALAVPIVLPPARFFLPPARRLWYLLLLAALFGLQVLFTLRQANFYWVG